MYHEILRNFEEKGREYMWFPPREFERFADDRNGR